MDLTNREKNFPVTERWIYLDHAAVAPLPHSVATCIRTTITDVEKNGITSIREWRNLYSRTRASVARLIGADAHQIAFTKNTTDGLLLVANGIEWCEGDNVVIARREFPANVYPWLNLAKHGVNIHWVPERGARLSIDDFADAVDPATRVLSVSSVEFFTGFRNDLAALGELCRKHDILFVVDGIQSVGALEINVTQLGIDCLAADSHKWLLGPEGCGLFFCSPKAQERLQVKALGWASVESCFDFLNYSLELQPDARRFETGTQNTAGIAGLCSAVEALLELSPGYVESRIMNLTDLLCELLSERQFQILSPRDTVSKSGIITFRHHTESSSALHEELRRRGVVCTNREGYLRFSPHYYNTEEEISRAVEFLTP